MPDTATLDTATAVEVAPVEQAEPKKPDTSAADKSALDAINARQNQASDAFDTNLAKLLAETGATDGDGKKPQRGPDGKFAKAAQPTDIPANSLAPRPDEPAPEQKKAAAKFSDDDLRRAVSAATRDTAPKSILKSIEQGDEDAISHYLKRAKVQDDGDEFSKKHKTLQQELESLKTKPAGNTGDGKGSVDATASQPDLDAAVAPLASHLAELLGEDSSPKVRESFALLHDAIAKSTTAHDQQRDQQITALQKRLDDMATVQARDALVSEYPDLKDKTVWDSVRERMNGLPESPDRPDLLTRLEHAARIELAPTLVQRAKAAREKRDTQRDNGAPSLSSRAGESPTRMARHELVNAAYDAKAAGDEERVAELQAEIKRRS